MENEAVCKDKEMAILILETLKEKMTGTQKEAIEAVIIWIQKNGHKPASNMTPEERDARIVELLKKCRIENSLKDRELMSIEERKETAAYYLEGIEKKENTSVKQINNRRSKKNA